MTTNVEGNNSSRAIAINLVNNPRDFFKDAVIRSLSRYKLSKSLVFASVTKLIYRFNKVYSLIKNENKETENQFPYGMCNAYISDTFIDHSLLEKDCIKFVKDQKTEVLHYLEDLDKFLIQNYSEREGDSLQSELNNINAMPDDVDPSTAKADAMAAFNIKLNAKNKEYLIENIHSLEESYYLELEIIRLSDNSNPQKLLLTQNKLDSIKDDNPDNSILKTKYLSQLKLLSSEEEKRKQLIYIIAAIDDKKYFIVKDDKYVSQEEYHKQIKIINQEKLQYENQIKDNIKKQQEITNTLRQYRKSNVSVLSLKNYDSERVLLSTGIIEQNKIAIEKQKVFLNNSFLEISKIWFGYPVTPFFLYDYKSKRYGNSIFWATLMPTYFSNLYVTYAGHSRNENFKSIFKIFFAKRESTLEVNPTVFEEEFYEPNDPNTFTVLCTIQKNTSPISYGHFYISSKESPYLASLINKEVLFKNKESNKPIEFYPVIPVRELNKDLVEYDPIDIKSTLGFACEELLRNLYINIYGITKAVNKIGKESLEIICNASESMKTVKAVFDYQTANKYNNIFSQNDTQKDVIDFYNNKTDKLNRKSTLNISTNEIIQDVYLALGISVDNFDSASAKYLYELFSKLIPECKITKEKFLAYQDHQINNDYKYLDNYTLENHISIRNTHYESLLSFNYIEEETKDGKWAYWNPLYKDTTVGYCEVELVSKEDTSNFIGLYNIYDNPTLSVKSTNINETFKVDEYYIDSSISYKNSVLILYKQVEENTYTKLSIHGLKIKYNRRFLLPFENKKFSDSSWGTYSSKNKNSNKYKKYRNFSDLANDYSLEYFSLIKDSQKAEVTNTTPKENMDLSNFIIPLWHHDITEDSYYKKYTQYTINDVNNVLQKSFNLLVFGTLKDNQTTLINLDTDYYVPEVQRKKILLSCLDSFISKFNKFEKFNRYLTNTIDTEEDKDKEVYTDLFYQIATNPNVSAYCKIPPTWNKPNYMVGQNKVSSSVSSQLMNNKSTFYFETLSQENKIFGDIEDNKFNFN